jgi:hypothetical protein
MLPNARKTGRLYYSDALDQNQLPRLIVHSTWIDDRWLILDIIPSVALLSGHSSAYCSGHYRDESIYLCICQGLLPTEIKPCRMRGPTRMRGIRIVADIALEVAFRSYLNQGSHWIEKKALSMLLAPKIKRTSITFFFSPTDFL